MTVQNSRDWDFSFIELLQKDSNLFEYLDVGENPRVETGKLDEPDVTSLVDPGKDLDFVSERLGVWLVVGLWGFAASDLVY